MKRRNFLKKTSAAGLYLGLGSLSGIRCSSRGGFDFDLILSGGVLIDGSGAVGIPADVGIKGEQIAAVGDLSGAGADRIMDVSGLTVTPGFIDVHTHSEDELLINPKAESKVRQGVTTEFLGMDGESFDPESFGSELEKLEKQGIAVNAGSMVGQGTLRRRVMEMSDRAATAGEIEQMRELAALAFRQGAIGISSGLEYTPGGFASTEEITELCKVIEGTNGLYATHMRNEDDRVVEAVEEAIAIAEGAGIGLQISHLKCQGRRNWEKLDRIFSLIEQAEERDVSVTMDRYPYLAYSTGLSNLMPLWCREGGTEKFIERLQDPDVWPRIRSEMEDKIALLGSWDAVMISSVRLDKNKPLQGKTISEILKDGSEDPYLYTRSLIIEEEDQVGQVGFGMSEENTARILAHPKCMPASDGSALADYGTLGEGSPHPRSYGTFTRVLGKYVREMKVMRLEEAIRKMTRFPAERYGLEKRGRITEGFMADLVVLDPETVADQANYSDPHQYSVGIEAVLVNGKVVFENGERTEELPGKILRGSLVPVSPG